MLLRTSSAGVGGGAGSETTIPIVAPTATATMAGPNHHGLRLGMSRPAPLSSTMLTDAFCVSCKPRRLVSGADGDRDQCHFTRPSRSEGHSESASSTRSTYWPPQWGVGYAPSFRSMLMPDTTPAYWKRSHHSSPYHSSRPIG